ncbi:hypothetical protein ES703_38731 [subsurface metagenome]
MTKMRMLVSIAVALALLLALMPTAAFAAEEGSASGQFTVGNVDPTVDAVALVDTGEVAVTAMTPQVEYNVKVDVTDANTLDDLSTVEVTIFYDADGTYAAGEETGAADTQTRAILTCTVAATPTWSIDPSASTTWVLVEANCVQPALTGTSDTFEFHFKAGKVATETVAPARWHIYAEADDGGGTPGSNTLENRTMNWYGEITVNTASVDWGTVNPGLDFGDVGSDETGISVTYIANGAYDEKVAATGTWTGGSGNATLDATGTCASADEFALKADDTATLASAVLVTASPTYVAIDDTGVQTAEAGDTVAINTLWLKLATIFSEDTYSGTIYYQIADGS